MENNIIQPTKGESRIIKFMILLGIFSILNFLYFFFQPEHVGNIFLFVLLSFSVSYSILKKFYMWYNYSNISVPDSPVYRTKFKVDILTTYFPGEPLQMTITTLEAINNITYPHTTYLCDEANDPFLKDFCQQNGIIHVTRDNRKDAKAGNINNALQKHAKGDICVVLDPDHIPEPNFLDSILPHFDNPEIGFVQIVQSYYNTKETLVARGAAEQTFQFYGPMMMTLNSYGAVNSIGANCVFRRKALDSIDGHAPGLCEDMHTAMLLYSKGWKAVYLPLVLAKGLAPSNLTNFFKQQLKWSRGTFDLLLNVYPKIFSKLTGRQKIHFGIMPLHYLGGIVSLFNFLIPILSLVFSVTPWRGNIIDFGLVLLPVATSSLLIRTFIQKWVIEKKERGFHILGGLLHINTWWIYIVGLVYTLINKKVPYLPTPKENEWNTNYKIVAPNAVVALLSILAVIYGLQQDLTPFSIVMAIFAVFNAFIMLFGIYLTHKVTNQNRILRTNLGRTNIRVLYSFKKIFFRTAEKVFYMTRRVALPLLLFILITSMGFKSYNDQSKWNLVQFSYFEKTTGNYFGIFNPTNEEGLSNIQEIHLLENQQNIDFDIISYYLAWDPESISEFPHEEIHATFQKNSIPMITWEPWASQLTGLDTVNEIRMENNVLKSISEGNYDKYIIEFAAILKSYDKPFFLRFAHEFDNPQYPWSTAGQNTPEQFKAAWKHVYHLLKAQDLHKVMMVWNPWEAASMAEYYPGDEYVDWIGITLLNYGPFNQDGRYYPFEELYRPFHDELKTITRKPVMLAEFAAVRLETKQEEWMIDAIQSIKNKFKEVSAVVMFNSAYDLNIPDNDWYAKEHIDWTTSSMNRISTKWEHGYLGQHEIPISYRAGKYLKNSGWSHQLKGIHYNKGRDWRNNYYSLTKEVLEKDFKLMQNAGINTIQYAGGNIYDSNFLKYSRKYDLNVIYEFEVNTSQDFISNQELLNQMTKGILNKVQEIKDYEHIIGYAFPYNLKEFFNKPLLFRQEAAYLNWLNTLLTEIKSIDKKKAIVLDITLTDETATLITQMSKFLPVDSFGLLIENPDHIDPTLQVASKQNISVHIGSLKTNKLEHGIKKYKDQDIILENWQDKRRSNSMNFDGIIDHKGRKKEFIKILETAWGNSPVFNPITTFRILKPSVALIPGETHQYHAMLLVNNSWTHGENLKGDYRYEWNLVKMDTYGNVLAIKELGTGASIAIKIPREYLNYEIMLVVKERGKDYIRTSRSTLHTPAVD